MLSNLVQHEHVTMLHVVGELLLLLRLFITRKIPRRPKMLQHYARYGLQGCNEP